MTQNQLKYWELRWKQHYEKILAEVKVREIAETERKNRAVEQETARHNRRQERIDTQNMIINRMNLDARWAELDEKKRAAMVAEAINEKKYELAVQQELRETTYTKAQINKMLSDIKLASMDMAMSIVKSKHDIAANYLKAEAALFKNGWARGTAGEVVADIKSLMSSTEFDKLFEQMKGDPIYSWITETYGPDASNQILDANARNTNNDGSSREKSDQMKRFENRPDFNPIIKDNDPKVTGFSKSQGSTGVTTGVTESVRSDGKIGSTKESIEIKPSNGTSGVIYSPGSHYGPGWNI